MPLSGSFVVRESRVLTENFAAILQAARKEIILSTSAKQACPMGLFSGPRVATIIKVNLVAPVVGR